MLRNKLSTDLTEEELIKLVKEDVDSNTILYNDVEKFLSFFNVTQGNIKISHRLLYKIYCLWSHDPIPGRAFSSLMQDYLGVTSVGMTGFFLISNIPNELKQKSLALLQNQRAKSPGLKKHFDTFLSYYDITPGNTFLESYVLYYLYDKWIFNSTRKVPLGYNQVLGFLKLYFKVKRKTKIVNGRLDTSKTAWFGISNSIYKHISKEEIQQIREGRLKYHGKRSYAKKRKKAQEEPQK